MTFTRGSLHKLEGHYTEMPQDLRSNILVFYRDLGVPISTKTHSGDWARMLKELDLLQSVDADLQRPAVAAMGAPLSK